jgi:hypothetical protein
LIPTDEDGKTIEIETTSKKQEDELKRSLELGTTVYFQKKEYFVDEVLKQEDGVVD